MKTFRYLLSCLICLAAAIAITSNAESKSALSKPAYSIPIKIMGKTVEIRKGLTRAEIKSTMSSVIKDGATIDINERLQYDVILAEEQAPVTIYFDFDEKGIIAKLVLDSYEAAQNPSVTEIVKWLDANAGKPKINKKRGTKTWIFGGWKIEHTDHGSGDDSMYSIELTLQK